MKKSKPSKKNKISKRLEIGLEKDELNEMCPLMEYRILSPSTAFSLGIAPTGMSTLNCVIMASSGSSTGSMAYFFNYCRIDGTKIDQEPYGRVYYSGSQKPDLYGLIHHADFSGRTEELAASELTKIAVSGASANISFTAKPQKESGTIEELRSERKLGCFEFVLEQLSKSANEK